MPKVKNIFDQPAIRLYIILRFLLDLAIIISKIFDLHPLNQTSLIVTLFAAGLVGVALVSIITKRSEELSHVIISLFFSHNRAPRILFRGLTAVLIAILCIAKYYGDTVSILVIVILGIYVICWELVVRKTIMNKFFIFIKEKKSL